MRRFLASAVLLVLTACGGSTDVQTGAQVDGGGTPGTVVIDDSIGRDDTLRRAQDQGGLLYRIHVRGGAGPEALSVAVDGLVVQVADTSVFRSAGDFTSWQLTPAGVESLQLAIADSGLLDLDNTVFGDADSSAGVSAGIFVGQGRVIEVHDLAARTGFTAGELANRDRFRALLDRLADHAWLGAGVVSAPRPWVPGVLGLRAAPAGSSPGRPAAVAATPPSPWPLAAGIRSLSRGTDEGPYGPQLLVCLTEEEVEPVWRLLTGVNTAYLGVDDGEQWELNVVLGYPGYRTSDEPCPA